MTTQNILIENIRAIFMAATQKTQATAINEQVRLLLIEHGIDFSYCISDTGTYDAHDTIGDLINYYAERLVEDINKYSNVIKSVAFLDMDTGKLTAKHVISQLDSVKLELENLPKTKTIIIREMETGIDFGIYAKTKARPNSWFAQRLGVDLSRVFNHMKRLKAAADKLPSWI